MFDSIDTQILNVLQSNARTSNAEIARQVGMAPSATLERVRKLEERGAIQGYEARLDPRALGLTLLAFVSVRSNEVPGCAMTGAELAAIPEVLEVHHVAGDDCYLLKMRAASPEALGRVLRERVGSISTVTGTRSTIVLGTIKETAMLPVGTAHHEAARPEKVATGA
jgi:Lrp/AsnC family leucine-responsive transcriptional regulator